MIAALRDHLARLPHPVRRPVPDAAQPLEPVGPELVHRDHGDRHGADHRVAQHRPVGRIAARLPRLHDGHGADRLDPDDTPPRLRPAVHVARRAGRRRRRWAPSSAAFQGFIIAYGGVPAFIVTLGGFLVWRGLIFPYAQGQTLAPMDHDLRAARRRPDRLARRSGGAGSSASLACVGIIYSLIASRRRRRGYGFPLRPMWAEVTIGIARLWRGPRGGRDRQQLPVAGLAGPPVRPHAQHHRAAGRAADPDRHRLSRC